MMKRLVLLTMGLTLLLALCCGSAQADGDGVMYYFMVSVTDCSSDSSLYASCTNGSGRIVMYTERQDGSIGPTWEATVKYAEWDHEGITLWYTLGSDGGTSTKPAGLDSSLAIDAFPTQISLLGNSVYGEEGLYYPLRNLNKTYTAKEKFTLWISSDGIHFTELQSWNQTADTLDGFDDDMLIDEDKMPTVSGLARLDVSDEGEIPIPRQGGQDEIVHFDAIRTDQYGVEWYRANASVYYRLAEDHDGISIDNDGKLTITDEAAVLSSYPRYEVTVNLYTSYVSYTLNRTPKMTRTLTLVNPQYILTYFSDNKPVAIYEQYYGTTWTHPNDIPVKTNDSDYHYTLTGWGTPSSVTVTQDMNFTANYTAEVHNMVLTDSCTNWYCTVCGRTKDAVPGDFLAGSGTSTDPYLIQSAVDWEHLSNYIAAHARMPSGCYRLQSDITVSTMLGSSDFNSVRPFTGVFDGNGHTLTFTAENPDDDTRVAPFAYVRGATIRNLRTTGSVTGSYDRVSGLIGENTGNTTIENCRVSMNLSGKCLVGGFCIGDGGGLTLKGCVFDGSISASNWSGGFVGWTDGNLTLSNCLFAPSSASGASECYPFYYDNTGNHGATLNNSYFLTSFAFGSAQSEQAFAITAGNGVTIDFGTPVTAYGLSGVTAYSMGLMYNGVFYAGKGETVSLYLPDSDWEGYTTTFAASAGTLTQADSGWTLVMSSENAIISIQRTPTFATAPAVRLTADGGTDGYRDQDPDKLFDGLDDTKWCCAFDGTNWVEFHADTPVFLTAYAMTTAGDAANYLRRNPISWRLLGKRDAGDEWTVLVTVTNCDHLPAENCVEVFFPLNNAVACQYYRLEVTAVQSGSQMQLAEFKLVGTPDISLPEFGPATFIMPAQLTTIEESAFEGMTAMTIVDASHVSSIGKWAFKGCTGLTQIRLPADCAIDGSAFDGCGRVYVYAPAGGTTEVYCQSDDNPCVFVEEAQN